MYQRVRKQVFRVLRWVAVICVVVLGVTVGISYRTFKTSMGRVRYTAHQQERIEYGKQVMRQAEAQAVTFTAADGVQLQGLLILRPQAQRTIMICHGYKSAKELLHHFVTMLADDNLFLFDFRAHGQSGGNLVTLGHDEVLDVRAAIQFLQSQEETKDLPLYGIGISMGGVSLLRAAVKAPAFKALVIDSAFARLDEQVAQSFYLRTGLPRYPFLPIARWMFEIVTGIRVADVDTVDAVRQVGVPVLFIHAENDEEIPVGNTYRLYEAARGVKELWLVPVCPHGAICREYFSEYRKRVGEFFEAAER